ncbi:hypothetical protein EJ08DRAFT_557505, partial [Tothia fuscella]
IRLLRLERTAEDESITGLSLIHVILSTAPGYEAVSYVWGDPERTHTIALADGKALPLTTSLARALPHFVRTCVTGHLWIDQITINQSNIEERSQQVEIMGSVYGQSYCALIWIDSYTP